MEHQATRIERKLVGEFHVFTSPDVPGRMTLRRRNEQQVIDRLDHVA